MAASRFSLHCLAHLRFPPEASRGRRYPEPPHPYRSPFQRDRDRVIHSRAFRRLAGKTQVFATGISDHFRARLTHTIEVSQIARTVAQALGLEVELAEALALAHDIGHPPFGHAGEDQLHLQMQRFGDRFEHNLHALHLVERFERRYAAFPGLNLTFEVREGILKHSRDYAAGDLAEADEYLPGLRPPLEAQLIDLVDEIAYNIADLDDAHHARLVSCAGLAQVSDRFDACLGGARTQFPGVDERVLVHEALRTLLDELVTGLLDGTAAAAQDAGLRTVDDVRRHPERVARYTAAAARTNATLKHYLRQTVYQSPELVAERQQSARKVSELFEYYLQHPDRMPEQYERLAEAEPLHRVVCDFIAGMTDSFFLRTWSSLVRQD